MRVKLENQLLCTGRNMILIHGIEEKQGENRCGNFNSEASWDRDDKK